MLKMRVVKPIHWSASPWNPITKLPLSSTVTFVKTMPPCNIPNDRCDFHLDMRKCRHIVVGAFGTEFMTNICMDEARFYFNLVEHDHDDLP